MFPFREVFDIFSPYYMSVLCCTRYAGWVLLDPFGVQARVMSTARRWGAALYCEAVRLDAKPQVGLTLPKKMCTALILSSTHRSNGWSALKLSGWLPQNPGLIIAGSATPINPSSTAVPIMGQTSLIPSDLSPKRDWRCKRVNNPQA